MSLSKRFEALSSVPRRDLSVNSPSRDSFGHNTRVIENLERFNSCPIVVSPMHEMRRLERLDVIKEELESISLARGPQDISGRKRLEAAQQHAKRTGNWESLLDMGFSVTDIECMREAAELEANRSFTFEQSRFLASQQDVLVGEESFNLRLYLEALYRNQLILARRLDSYCAGTRMSE